MDERDRRRAAHRPARYADLTEMIDAAGGDDGGSTRADIAAATAAVVVQAGRVRAEAAGTPTTATDADRSEADGARRGTADGMVELADRVGLDTLAELWRDADPVSLPGALWALYLLRQWCQANGAEVVRLWRAGQPVADVDTVVAGIPEYADVEAVHRVVDAVLAGAYGGDFAVALERAAALFRVVGAGRRALADDGPAGSDGRRLAERNERAAADLTRAAGRWRAGTLA